MTVQATPDGGLFEEETDHLRDQSEITAISARMRETQDWLHAQNNSKEPWEHVDVYFAPPGLVNRPWLIGKSRYILICVCVCV